MVPLLMFGGRLGFVDSRIAKLSTPAFAYTLMAVVVINVGFAISSETAYTGRASASG